MAGRSTLAGLGDRPVVPGALADERQIILGFGHMLSSGPTGSFPRRPRNHSPKLDYGNELAALLVRSLNMEHGTWNIWMIDSWLSAKSRSCI